MPPEGEPFENADALRQKLQELRIPRTAIGYIMNEARQSGEFSSALFKITVTFRKNTWYLKHDS